MITLHPSGITHGPHPNAFKQGAKHARKSTDEVAVMIDSRAAFLIGERASQIELPEYVDSWKIVTEENV